MAYLQATPSPPSSVSPLRGGDAGAASDGLTQERTLRKTGLIKCQQLGPGTLGIGFVKYWISVLGRHIRNAPTVLRLRINFDLRRDLGCTERLFQLVFCVRLLLVVVCRDSEIHTSFDLRREQMRTIGIRRHQSTAVERRRCAHAVWQGSSGPDDERSAHAVALRANLLACIDLLLRIQKRDIRSRIFFSGA